MKKLPRNCTCTESGFYISHEEPFLGATPDALIHCDCCGDGCLEIKSPFTGKEKFLFELLRNDLPLFEENSVTKVNVNDNYCYQIQCQLFVTKKIIATSLCGQLQTGMLKEFRQTRNSAMK